MCTAWYKDYNYMIYIMIIITIILIRRRIQRLQHVHVGQSLISSRGSRGGSCLPQLWVQLWSQWLVCMACVWKCVHNECTELLIESVRSSGHTESIQWSWSMAVLSSQQGESTQFSYTSWLLLDPCHLWHLWPSKLEVWRILVPPQARLFSFSCRLYVDVYVEEL